MDVREKLVELLMQLEDNLCDDCGREPVGCAVVAIADHLIANGVRLEEKQATSDGWISVKDRTPTEADGTVWVCLADVFPYNEKEPYPDAKHDKRISEAHYSEFTQHWYKDGAVFPNGIVTHWMEKAQPPKGE